MPDMLTDAKIRELQQKVSKLENDVRNLAFLIAQGKFFKFEKNETLDNILE